MLLAEPVQRQRPLLRDHGIGRGDVAVKGQRFVPRLDQVHTLAVDREIAVEYGVVQVVGKFHIQGAVPVALMFRLPWWRYRRKDGG